MNTASEHTKQINFEYRKPNLDSCDCETCSISKPKIIEVSDILNNIDSISMGVVMGHIMATICIELENDSSAMLYYLRQYEYTLKSEINKHQMIVELSQQEKGGQA